MTEESKTTLKVDVNILDALMNLAGELVLSRNQLLQGVNSSNIKTMELSGQRIDLITSELQETIMKTRMQPMDNILDQVRRLVRDKSLKQNKSIDLVIEGNEVELDKTIMESISSPLLKLVEFAVEHGIEPAPQREKTGKSPAGAVVLRAFHDAGQVNILLSDDGCGYHPGMADGMDEIIAQIEQIGGAIDMEPVPEKGTDIKIKLPLTLAIIPSQITAIGKERFAIPQVDLNELVRISPARISETVEKIGEASVVRLRGEVLPLLDLCDLLGMKNDSDKPVEKALNIAVVSAGGHKYGLIVDAFLDSEEIVVKPLGRHLKDYKIYGGATIMGDGKVALILDILNLSQIKESVAGPENSPTEKKIEKDADHTKEKVSLITFKNAENEYFSTYLQVVERIERIASSDIEKIGDRKVIQYRGGALELFELSQAVKASPLPDRSRLDVIVFRIKEREAGLLISPPVNTVEMQLNVDESTSDNAAVIGSVIIEGHTTLLIDTSQLVRVLKPEWFK